MPKMLCPKCQEEMKENKDGAYVCPDCGGAFLPKSIFGVTIIKKKPP